MAYRVIDKEGKTVSEGRTPTTVTLNRSSGYFQAGSYTIEVLKGGKVVTKESVTAGINGWYFGNILIGGLIGMVVVDPLSGAMFRMPDAVTVNTAPGIMAYNSQETLKITDIATLTPGQRAKLIRI